MKKSYQTKLPSMVGKPSRTMVRAIRISRMLGLFYALLYIIYPAQSSNLPSGFAETRLATGLDPTGMEFAPDGRLFVLEKSGKVRILKNGSLLTTPFLALSVNNTNERGLLGIAFDPNFATNQYVYLYYTTPGSSPRNRVSRFKANGDVVVSGSEQVIFELDYLSAGNHNGGSLFFKDGKLFILTGENAQPDKAQSLTSLLGKMLRINPDGTIPADNPYYSKTTGNYRAIWAIGFRNPFKATIQPGTGRIFINDVGGSKYEEINEGIAGKNYGWPGIEGLRTNQTAPANYQNPLFAYSHSVGCSITGGAFYNPATVQLPSSYVGQYFYADYCNGNLKTLDPDNGYAVGSFASGINRPIDVKVAPDGSVFYIARGGLGGGSVSDNTSSTNGEVWRVRYTGSNVPTISAQPTSQTASLGASVTFTVGASGSGTLSYQWQRNGVAISGATAASYTISSVASTDDGDSFRVVVKNASGSVTSNGATLTVSSNRAPTASITSPTNHTLYRAGTEITFSGIGTDPEDGNLPSSAYDWEVVFYHDTHTHPGPTVTVSSDGKTGSFEIPNEGELASNVWYRLFLNVTDSKGVTRSSYVDLDPKVVTLSFETNPVGLSLNLDGQLQTTPFTEELVSGMLVSLAAPLTQTVDGDAFDFENWENGLGIGGSITVPDNNTTYTATYAGGQSYRTPENPSNTLAGVEYSYFEGSWGKLPNFSSMTPVQTGNIATFSLSPRQQTDEYSFQFEGYLDVPSDGAYTLYTSSDDGSKLYIGSTLVVSNDGIHSMQERSGTINLKKGKHAIRVEYFERLGGDGLTVSYAGPGISKKAIPASALYRSGNTSARTETIVAKTPSGEKMPAVHCYPVPATDILVIESEGELSPGVALNNAQGYAYTPCYLSQEKSRIQLQIGELPSGVYFVIVQASGQSIIRKVVKQ